MYKVSKQPLCYWIGMGGLFLALWLLVFGEHAGDELSSRFGGRKVLVIGIDGLRPDALFAAEAPNLQDLVENGAWTFSAVAGGEIGTPSQQATVSGPGWSSILTGVWADRHGVVDNSFAGRRYDRYPHFFQRLKEAEPDSFLASIVSWHPVDDIIVAAVGDSVGYRAKGAGATYEIRDRSVRDLAVAHLAAADPDVVFLHLDQVDGAGHGYGFSPSISAYTGAIARVDALVGDVLEAMRARPHYAGEDWLVVVTTDHGGLGLSHGGQTFDERRIFLIVSGGKARAGEVEAAPGHTAVPATVLAHLGVAVDPDWGWVEGSFGLPPYPPSGLRATEEPDRSVFLRWDPPEELPADGLELLRNGVAVGRLALNEAQFVDRPPVEEGVEARFRYVLRTLGSPVEVDDLIVDAVLPAGPRDALVLDLDFGDGARDHSGAENHGMVRGFPDPVDGPGGLEAWRFARKELLRSGVEVPDSEALRFGRNTNFTFSVWVRVDAGSGAGAPFFGNREKLTGTAPGWALGTGPETAGWQWVLADGAGRAGFVAPGGSLDGKRWRLLTAVHERYRVSRLYVDGEEGGSSDLSRLREADSSRPVEIGGWRGFTGSIAQPRIWRRALTAEEVRREYAEQRAYSDWRERRFSGDELDDGAVAGDLADPDGDGMVNLQEFGWGEDPMEAGSRAGVLEIARALGEWVIRTRVRSGGRLLPDGRYAADGLLYGLEGWNEGARRWEGAGEAFHITFPPGEPGSETREMVFQTADQTAARPFSLFRIRMTLQS